jgi:hypothetical protein
MLGLTRGRHSPRIQARGLDRNRSPSAMTYRSADRVVCIVGVEDYLAPDVPAGDLWLRWNRYQLIPDATAEVSARPKLTPHAVELLS